MVGRSARAVLLAGAVLVWAASLARLRATAQACLPPDVLGLLESRLALVAQATGCAPGQVGADPLTRAWLAGVVVLLPLALLVELTRGSRVARLVAPLVAVVRRLVGLVLEPAPRAALVVGPVEHLARSVPLPARTGHSFVWSHRGPPRFV
ncbi:hypothetical protein [Cellulomonas composti]|uniref:Uncharacterized protein n=1 Tax=Cellulomonas composti TaxID=266130 RepID=A0A511J7J5_9CELL|nr:hypothetical protein [Cellulomonas composti]GEL93982.1 hypothetical protein CCO02nite_06400 [Cellulomonas composti]